MTHEIGINIPVFYREPMIESLFRQDLLSWQPGKIYDKTELNFVSSYQKSNLRNVHMSPSLPSFRPPPPPPPSHLCPTNRPKHKQQQTANRQVLPIWPHHNVLGPRSSSMKCNNSPVLRAARYGTSSTVLSQNLCHKTCWGSSCTCGHLWLYIWYRCTQQCHYLCGGATGPQASLTWVPGRWW